MSKSPEETHHGGFRFLDLPFELRLIIYKMVVQQLRAITNEANFNYWSREIILQDDTMKPRRDQRNFYLDEKYARRSRAILHSDDYKLGRDGLWSTCRQVHDEMNDILHTRPIRLSIIDDLFMTKCSDSMTIERLLERQPWICRHTTELRIQFALFPKRFSTTQNDIDKRHFKDLRRHGLGAYKNPSLKGKLQPASPRGEQNRLDRDGTLLGKSRSLLRFPRSKSGHHESSGSIQTLITKLSAFPKLGKIEIMWDNDDIVKTWTAFAEDLAAFAPTGVPRLIVVFEPQWMSESLLRLIGNNGLILSLEDPTTYHIREFSAKDCRSKPSVLQKLFADWRLSEDDEVSCEIVSADHNMWRQVVATHYADYVDNWEFDEETRIEYQQRFMGRRLWRR